MLCCKTDFEQTNPTILKTLSTRVTFFILLMNCRIDASRNNLCKNVLNKTVYLTGCVIKHFIKIIMLFDIRFRSWGLNYSQWTVSNHEVKLSLVKCYIHLT